MIISLQVVTPPSEEYVPLRPASRACWTQPELVDEFGDLLAWRDRLYQQHFVR